MGRLLTAAKGRYSNNVGRTYNAAGRVTAESLSTHGETYTVAADYDPAGRLNELTYPDGSLVERTMDARGLLIAITRDAAAVLAREYDNGGRLIEQTFGNNVVEEFVWNNDNALASINGPAGLFEYTYDLNQNRRAKSGRRPPTAGPAT